MKSKTYCKSAWLRAAMAIMVGAAMCVVLGLTACGGTAEQSASSDETSAETSSTESSTEVADAQDVAAALPSEAYVFTKTVINTNDGVTITEVFDMDDSGRQLGGHYEETSADSSQSADFVASDWDEYGHILKGETTNKGVDGDDTSYTDTMEMTNDVNEDGTLSKQTETLTVNKDSFEEGELASRTTSRTFEYGSDGQVVRKSEMKSDFFDQSGKLIQSVTETDEFDENGLQTSMAVHYDDGEGNTDNEAATITWTTDADGKPTSFVMELSLADGSAQTATADVAVDESGLVSQISNFVVDGEARSSSFSIEHKRIENPLPNAFEGWKNLTLTDLLLSR